MRLVALVAITVCVVSCSGSALAQTRATSRPRDPSISGKDNLLSESDFRALLMVARQRLAKYPYHPAVYNVLVLSPAKVRVHFREEDGSAKGRWLLLERGKNAWRVTGEQSLAERVILD